MNKEENENTFKGKNISRIWFDSVSENEFECDEVQVIFYFWIIMKKMDKITVK